MMKLKKQRQFVVTSAAIIIFATVLICMSLRNKTVVQEKSPTLSVLSVAMTQVQAAMLPIRVPATGNVVAWQEASVGAEGDGFRLIEVRVNVGDTVKRGQVLALFYGGIVEAELAETQASVTQAEAEVLEAEANAKRAKSLNKSGAISTQHTTQLLVSAMTAQARLDGTRAIMKKNQLRLAQTRVLAPSDGIITSRSATVGAVVPAGQELFRLIEDNRLEWRAVVSSSDIDILAPGQQAMITTQGHDPIQGTVRMVAPTIDNATHNGLVYVDLPTNSGFRAGSFARGYVEVSKSLALTLPQSAVILRDGFHYVMQVGPNSLVTLKKVTVGRQVGERTEITAGLKASDTVIASGLSFLSEGDLVRVVSEPATTEERG